MTDKPLDTLDMLQSQIDQLQEMSKKGPLSMIDVRRLEILINMQHRILNRPIDKSDVIEGSEYTDEEIAAVIKKGK